jgi:hypothetical protein
MVTTTEPRRSPEHRPTRRALLASAALMAPASLLPAIAAAAFVNRGQMDPDPHPAWFAEWRALIEWQDTTHTGGRDLEQFWQYHRTLELEELIGGTSARTLAGVAAQLRVADHWLGGSAYAGEDVDAAIGNALATVERLAGGVPVPVAPAVAAAPPGSDAALLALGCRLAAADDRSHRRWCALEDEGEIGSRDEPVIRAAVAEIHACIGEVGRLPARTPAGLLVKARIVRDEVTMGSTMCADEVARTLVADLERLAGEATRV